MQQERAIVLIDGSNFYFKLRDLNLHQLLTFDFTSLLIPSLEKVGLFPQPTTLVRCEPMEQRERKRCLQTSSVYLPT